MAKKLVFANNPLFSGPTLMAREKGGIPYSEIALASIERDVNQPRVNFDEDKLRELADSIKTYGVLSPILVRPSKVAGRYALIAGERRVRAARLAGLTTIPAIVDTDTDQNDSRTLSIQLVENLQRSELTPLERANAIGALRDAYGLSIREVAAALGVSKGMVERSLSLLDLPDDLLNAIRNGASESKVLRLAKVEDPEIRAKYLENFDNITRDELERGISGIVKHPRSKKEVNHASSPEDARIADEIQQSLGVKVKLQRPSPNAENGKMIIEFYSEDDLKEIFRKLVS